MNFDPYYIFTSLTFSTIGFGYFKYGKKTQNFYAFIVGILLMIYPYFLSDLLWMILVGIGLMLIPWAASKWLY